METKTEERNKHLGVQIVSTDSHKTYPKPDYIKKETTVEEVANLLTDKVKDAVDHPSHYNQGNIEVIDFIEDQAHLGWCRLNAIKYTCRSGSKTGETKEQSIKKAIYYLERELGMHRKEQ